MYDSYQVIVLRAMTSKAYMYNTTDQNITIGDFNRDNFIRANPYTFGNFPGWELGVRYVAYVFSYDKDYVKSHTYLAESKDNTPMILSGPPQVF